MKRSLAAAVVALLALPAAASAHPGVYTVTQTYRLPNTTCKYGDADQCLPRPPARSTRSQRRLGAQLHRVQQPGAERRPRHDQLQGDARAAGADTMSAETKRTCAGRADQPAGPRHLHGHRARGQGANILAWQGGPVLQLRPVAGARRPASAIDPSEWLTLVKNVTGVDLSALTTVDALKTACERGPVNGTYRTADTPASITDAQIAAATGAPLQSQITTLQTGLTNVTAQFTAAETARKALVARPLALTLSAKRAPNVVMVTGATGTAVSVRMRISSADARKLKIARTLATKTKTLDAQGAGLFTLTPSTKARKAIKKDVKVTVEAVGGGVTKTASGVVP